VPRPSKRRRQEQAAVRTPAAGPGQAAARTPAAGPGQDAIRAPGPGPRQALDRTPAARPREAGPASPVPARYRAQRVKIAPPWWQTPWAWGGGAGAAVVVVVVVFIILAVNGSPSSGGSNALQPVPASVLNAVTGVSPTVSSTIGGGGVTDPFFPISGTPNAATGPGGRPEIFYYGAEYCPYCAGERWSMVVALSRFGSFSNLHLTMSDSNPNDIPNTHTFSFYTSSYSSAYVDFAPVESEDRNGNPLQTPTAAQQSLINAYDLPPYTSQAGTIPFQVYGTRFFVTSSGVDPQLLQGMNWQQIAGTLTDAQNQVAQQIVGNANWLTAGICELTGNQPGSVCTAAPIPSLEAKLPTS